MNAGPVIDRVARDVTRVAGKLNLMVTRKQLSRSELERSAQDLVNAAASIRAAIK